MKISELTLASQVNETDAFATTQSSGGGVFASVKTTLRMLADKIITSMNFTSDLQTSNKTVSGAINEKIQSSSIAPVEVSPAESNHSVGEHITYNGERYKVTQAIVITDALVVGTNIAKETVDESLYISKLNDVDISSPTDDDAIVYDLTTQKWKNKAVKAMPDYSTSASYTGIKWIDGGKIFRKVIDVGASPVSVGSSSMSASIYIDDFISKPISCVGMPADYSYAHPLNVQKYDSQNIKVQSSMDNLSLRYFALEYVRAAVYTSQCVSKYTGGNDATVTLNLYDDAGILTDSVDVYLYDHMGESNAVTLGCLKVYYDNAWKLKCANYPCSYNGANYSIGDTIATWSYDASRNINNVAFTI